MSIDLPTDTMRFVEALVASGDFPSPQDAVAEGVRLLMTRKQLRDDIRKGIDELDAGHRIEGKTVFAELRTRANEILAKQGK